jgi:type IV pilus assembly protein PilM
MLARNGIKASRCVSAATGAAAVVVRVIEVPRMTPAELAETMKWEVERHIPFAANDVEMAYQPIDDPAQAPVDPNNPNMEVLLAVAQRDMVATHIETVQAAGLQPVAVDVEPLAAGRALLNLGAPNLAAGNAVVVNIGATNTDVAIFKNGTLRFPRNFPIAGDNFTRAIADYLGISMDAAEEEKRTNATILMDLLQAPATGGADFGGAMTSAGPRRGGAPRSTSRPTSR